MKLWKVNQLVNLLSTLPSWQQFTSHASLRLQIFAEKRNPANEISTRFGLQLSHYWLNNIKANFTSSLPAVYYLFCASPSAFCVVQYFVVANISAVRNVHIDWLTIIDVAPSARVWLKEEISRQQAKIKVSPRKFNEHHWISRKVTKKVLPNYFLACVKEILFCVSISVPRLTWPLIAYMIRVDLHIW